MDTFADVIELHLDSGRVLLGIRRFDTPFLLTTSLAYGLGSSEVPLDRGGSGEVLVAEFRRIGSRVVLVKRNKHFLATGDEAAVRAGLESFVQSIVWSADVEREKNGAVLVDATDLVVDDHHGIAELLRERDQGDYVVDETLSFPLFEECRTSPTGTRLPAMLTFRGPGLGDAVRAVAPDPRALTFLQYLILVPLPEPALPPRRYHPGSGGFGIGHADHGRQQPAGTQVRHQPRFRLERPIVFYADPAIPEPVRSAVIEGGNWWREGFEKAGFRDAYRVELLPDDVDPYDPGTNMVWWVHRSGRGWSQGQRLTDPRTGEIITGRVRLGSQRVEQVTALAEALLAPYGRADEDERRAAVEHVVLSRMRHLAAHEIGHALGFMHNYASTHHPKPSVMDYPHPRIRVTATGELDVSEAYSSGLGPWDLFLVAHAYGHFSDEELARLRREAAEAGLVYVSDADGRNVDAAHVDGVPWVTTANALDALDEVLRVRRIALDGFSPAVLPPDRQTGELEERAALLHLLHRHEVEAVARLVGGARYEYIWAGDAGPGVKPVEGGLQREALTRLASLLRAEHLALPAPVLNTVSPPAIRYERTREYLDTRSGRVFDPLSAVEAAAALVGAQLLEPTRLNRVAWQHAADPAVPGVREILDAVLSATWRRDDPVAASVVGGPAVQQAANWVLLRYVLAVLHGDTVHPQVGAEIRQVLRQLAFQLRSSSEAADVITRYLADPRSVHLDPLPRLPPGAPI